MNRPDRDQASLDSEVISCEVEALVDLAPCQIWFAHQTRTAADAIRDVAFGGSWEGVKAFAPAEYLHDTSDFTTDDPSVVESIRPLRSLTRATHSSYLVTVEVPASTNRLPNRAPWGLGADFVDFTDAVGSLTDLRRN